MASLVEFNKVILYIITEIELLDGKIYLSLVVKREKAKITLERILDYYDSGLSQACRFSRKPFLR